MAELAVGATFAGYRIEGFAGRGGMGVVFRARHLRLDRIDALKVIAPEFADDPNFRSRFERESQVAAQIDHPHVIRVYNADETGGRLYLAMQFVEGTDLHAELQRCGRFEVDRAVGIVSQVGSALDAAHERGLVHRDVKPANVLLAARDHAYLTDFGLTKRLDSHGRETRTGMFVGTTDYVAPEQVKGEQLDARADVYSLGCVLFHLLSGRVPYPTEHDIATAYAHLSQPPPSLAELRPELAEHFDPVIGKAMAKARAERYASAGEFAEAASAAGQRSIPASARPISALAPTKAEDGAPARTAASGWYPESSSGRMRRWTGHEWAEYAPDGSRADVLPPPGSYPEPGTGRLRRWTGSAWGEYVSPDRGTKRDRRPWRRRHPILAGLIALFVATIVASAIVGSQSKPPSSPTHKKTTHSRPAQGLQLTASELASALVPKSAYARVPFEVEQGGQDALQRASSSYPLQGGIPALKLCKATIRPSGLRADSASSYRDGIVLNVSYGSDAASFAGRGARQFLATASAQAKACHWRSLPGPRLGDQTVRLTTDKEDSGGDSLHDDVILVRSGPAVLEVGTATVSGSHSVDAENLTRPAARRLAEAVRAARKRCRAAHPSRRKACQERAQVSKGSAVAMRWLPSHRGRSTAADGLEWVSRVEDGRPRADTALDAQLDAVTKRATIWRISLRAT